MPTKEELAALSHDELAAQIQDRVVEAERRLVEDGGHPRALRAVKFAHDALDMAATSLAGAGMIQPMSGGTPKGG